MQTNPKTEIGRALHDAGRVPGWNFRTIPIRRFRLGDCMLIVVPARRFTYNRQERATAAYWREQGTPQGDAA